MAAQLRRHQQPALHHDAARPAGQPALLQLIRQRAKGIQLPSRAIPGQQQRQLILPQIGSCTVEYVRTDYAPRIEGAGRYGIFDSEQAGRQEPMQPVRPNLFPHRRLRPRFAAHQPRPR